VRTPIEKPWAASPAHLEENLKHTIGEWDGAVNLRPSVRQAPGQVSRDRREAATLGWKGSHSRECFSCGEPCVYRRESDP